MSESQLIKLRPPGQPDGVAILRSAIKKNLLGFFEVKYMQIFLVDEGEARTRARMASAWVLPMKATKRVEETLSIRNQRREW
jgi:hypothetical protein